MSKKPASKKNESTKVISFKVSSELYKQLQDISRELTHDTGLPLSPSQTGRRLMLEAMKTRRK